MLDELVSVPEAAKRLGGISVWTIYAWFSKGLLQKTRVGARRVMVRQSEIDRIVRDEPRKQKGVPEAAGVGR